MNCENCDIEHEGSYGSGRFCSSKCARGFSTKEKRSLINEKVSKSLNGRGHEDIKIICEECKKLVQINWRRRNQRFCSRSCSAIFKNKNRINETNEKISRAVRKAHQEGRCLSWKSRKNLEPSYPEQYFIDLFKNENISGWEREYKVGPYFIDFAFIDKKIALEIDGKQHWLNEDRIEKDKKKDILLKQEGWKVIRIKWFNPVNELNRQKLYPQIENFKIMINGKLGMDADQDVIYENQTYKEKRPIS